MTDEQAHRFYTSAAWKHKRREVMERYHGECQPCKARGRYTRAVIVHHEQHLKDRPDLALSDTYLDEYGIERRQLTPVCRDCHEMVCHPERMKKYNNAPLTEERW